jgi:CBS domain-containing protein
MTCESIMNRNPPKAHPDDTVGEAINRMIEQRVLALPIVNNDGVYLGLFAKSSLFSLILPRVIAHEDQLPPVAQLGELHFLQDDLPQIQERVAEISGHKIREYTDATAPIVHPDAPIIAALVHIHRSRNFVPVIQPDTGKLLGIISTWDVLQRLKQRS